jgi:hypothetical protein
MKRKIIVSATFVILVSAFFITIPSCKSIGRAAAKYWTNRQIREFVGKCEDKSAFILGNENAKKYCDCAVDVVAEKYRNYEDIKKISLAEVLKIANNCK